VKFILHFSTDLFESEVDQTSSDLTLPFTRFNFV